MKKEEFIDKVLDDLINSGSSIPYIKELKEEVINISNKDRSLKEVLNGISADIETYTRMFLDEKNKYNTSLLVGISTGIYLPDDGTYKYKIIGGTRFRDKDELIDSDTLFDVASITKLYTLILAFKLEELGLLDLNTKVSDLNPDIKGLEDFTLNDLIRLCGELRTDGNVATASTIKEAYDRLKTVFLLSCDRTKNKYTDFGALVIGDTIEKVISKSLGKSMKLDEIMNEFLFKPLYINNTVFTPKIINITGNTLNDGLPQDPKSRALGGVTGHAGLFTNSEDLFKLSDGLFNDDYLNKEHKDRLSEITFNGAYKGNLGLYVKHSEGWKKTYTPPEFSDKSFSQQGYTGGIAVFDLNNKIHNNILVNTVMNPREAEGIKNNKPEGFMNYFGTYQVNITKRIMLMYIAKKYYNKYCNVKEDIEETKLIR